MKKSQSALCVSDQPVALKQITEVAEESVPVKLNSDPRYRKKLQRSIDLLHAEVARGHPVYGVTTGFGNSCGNRHRAGDVEKLGENLIRFHGCGTGNPLSVAQSRAALFCRLISLAKGLSGVSPELLIRFTDFLNHGITPLIPSEGAVGASGDLTPLSYVAACLAGRRKVIYKGRTVPASRALREAGLAPYRFRPKEPLAIMNGTSVMTGIAVLAVARAGRILAAAQASTALTVHGLRGHDHHFHPGIFEAKPFRGQAEVAAGLRALLVDPRFSRGLPLNLALPPEREAGLHHGFKGMQITASALTAAAQKQAMPAGVFSRSTESHNQDKVSLGTLAARDANEICRLAQHAVAIHLLAAAQACRYRGDAAARPELAAVLRRVEAFSPPLVKDRPMDVDIETLAEAIGSGTLGES